MNNDSYTAGKLINTNKCGHYLILDINYTRHVNTNIIKLKGFDRLFV